MTKEIKMDVHHEVVSALGRSNQTAHEEHREWGIVDAYEAVAPYLKTGPSDVAAVALVVTVLTFIGFILWLIFG